MGLFCTLSSTQSGILTGRVCVYADPLLLGESGGLFGGEEVLQVCRETAIKLLDQVVTQLSNHGSDNAAQNIHQNACGYSIGVAVKDGLA